MAGWCVTLALSCCGCNALFGLDDRTARVGDSDGAGGATAGGGSGGGDEGGHGGSGASGGQGGQTPAQPSLAWVGRLQGSGNVFLTGLAVDSDGEVGLCGDFDLDVSYVHNSTTSQTLTSNGQQDIHVLKLDSGGAALWLTKIGGSGTDRCSDLALDAAGKVHIAGTFRESFAFGNTALSAAGVDTVCVAQLDASGTAETAVQLESGQQQRAWAIDVTETGKRWVVGDFETSITMGGQTATTGAGMFAGFTVHSEPVGPWGLTGIGADGASDDEQQQVYTVHAPSAVSGLGVLIGGRNGGSLTAPASNATGDSNYDPFVAELTTDGWLARVLGFASSGFAQTHAVASDAAGNIVVAGLYDNDLDVAGLPLSSPTPGWNMFAAKLSPSWSAHWALSFGLDGDDDFRGVALDPAGNIYLVGNYMEQMLVNGESFSSAGEQDGLLLSLTPEGAHRFHMRFTSSNVVFFRRVVFDDALDRVIVAGRFRGDMSIYLDNAVVGPTLSAGSVYNGFVAAFDVP